MAYTSFSVVQQLRAPPQIDDETLVFPLLRFIVRQAQQARFGPSPGTTWVALR
jgi:hypothetical protein